MSDILETASLFALEGRPESAEVYGCGHINDTYLVTTSLNRRYILQRINAAVFKNPEDVMRNFLAVTRFMRERIERDGGDPLRETLTPVPLKTGEMWYTSGGETWRVTLFIENTVTLQAVRDPKDLYNAGYAFGRFAACLADFPSAELKEIIPRFHDTPDRYRALDEAIKNDVCGRVQSAKDEIDFAMSEREFAPLFRDMQESGELPTRVTHNDTKINNVLFDSRTGRAVTVIDLDTVMPGLALNDFGDAVRFGTNRAAEDETDLSLVCCDLEFFENYAEGYLTGCGGILTENEIKMLPYAGKMMTLECGVRFLTDYLNGDTYFKIHRENHNLDRARNQFALVRDMTGKQDDLIRVIARLTAAN